MAFLTVSRTRIHHATRSLSAPRARPRSKRGLSPGETVKFPTALFPESDMWIQISFPREDADSMEITEPFSRIDVCIVEGRGIERTVVRHGFFDRFRDLNPPCDSAPES